MDSGQLQQSSIEMELLADMKKDWKWVLWEHPSPVSCADTGEGGRTGTVCLLGM